MKVVFTFGGLPRYLNPFLSKLNLVDNVEVAVVVPEKGNKTLGNGVKTDNKGINFKLIHLEEKRAIYGHFYFKGLLETLKNEKPDVLVVIWPYILDLTLNFKLRNYIKRNNIKVLLKEIPFDVPKYEDTFKYYKSDYALRLNEDLEKKAKVGLGFYIKHLILREIRKIYYRKVIDASICYADIGYDICTSYGLEKEKVFVSWNSTDTDELFEAAETIKGCEPVLEPNQNRIIHIGRLVKWKRVDLLLEATAKLKKDFPDIELVVIGQGKEKDNLIKKTDELGLNNNVNFVGGVYGEVELGRYLTASAIYVLAGMGGLSINQAMAFGKPVICSIADGTERILVRNGFNGYYFENADANDLADKIKLLLGEPSKVKKFGENSLSIVKNEVNLYTVINEYIKALNYITNYEFQIEEIKL